MYGPISAMVCPVLLPLLPTRTQEDDIAETAIRCPDFDARDALEYVRAATHRFADSHTQLNDLFNAHFTYSEDGDWGSPEVLVQQSAVGEALKHIYSHPFIEDRLQRIGLAIG